MDQAGEEFLADPCLTFDRGRRVRRRDAVRGVRGREDRGALADDLEVGAVGMDAGHGQNRRRCRALQRGMGTP